LVSQKAVPGAGEETAPHRPYSNASSESCRPAAWSELAQELSQVAQTAGQVRLRAGNLSAVLRIAVLATILNGSLEAVMIYEGIPLHSSHHNQFA